jgi:hypothetical protein
MNHRVASDAGLHFSRSRIHAMNGSSGNRAMTLVAHLVDIGNIQQPRILRTMRRVASQTALRFDSRVFENKRAARLHVALGANHVLVRCRTELIIPKGPVRIVAVAALHQSFIHLVVKGLAESRFDIGVAAEAKLWLCPSQQVWVLTWRFE